MNKQKKKFDEDTLLWHFNLCYDNYPGNNCSACVQAEKYFSKKLIKKIEAE
jgi:hypothetical protein